MRSLEICSLILTGLQPGVRSHEKSINRFNDFEMADSQPHSVQSSQHMPEDEQTVETVSVKSPTAHRAEAR